MTTDADRQRAREIVNAHLGTVLMGSPDREYLLRDIAAAIAAARTDALEEAAQWHDKQARYFDDHPNAECAGVFAMEHRHSAAALRNLKEPGHGTS